MRAHAEHLLAGIAGDDAAFRPGQWEAIEEVAVRRGRALVVQRTGWGKSAVYLIATKLLREAGHGPTVIVSPLLALMRNQIEMADRAGLNATTVNSTNREEWDEIFARIRGDEIDLLLISPERLNNPAFLSSAFPRLARSMGLLVVDEAHCISDWGHDFRPDYRRLSNIVSALPAEVPVLGTTATANDRVVNDVGEQMGRDMKVFRGPLDRESLGLQVMQMPNKAHRLAWLAAALPELPGAGIVYCLTIRDAQRVGMWLQDQGIDARVYTGGTDTDIRLDIEDELRAGRLKAVVATSALGMGYDNPFIEYVIHFQSPGSPVMYYQQVGRAGRAVPHAVGVLLLGGEDREIQDHFINTAFPSEQHTAQVLAALAEERTISDLEAEVNVPRGKLTGLLKILEVEGAVVRDGGRWSRTSEEWVYPRERVESVLAARRAERDAMAAYARTDACLMSFLRHQLDDDPGTDCGRCANCLGRPLVEVAPTGETQGAALEFLRRSHIGIDPRKRWPPGVKLPSPATSGCEEGRSLSVWGDPGWAQSVRQGLADGEFGQDLVDAAAAMVRSWSPEPAPTWVTAVPKAGEADSVTDLASRIAAELGLPFVPAVRRVATGPPQTSMQNSFQQFQNVHTAFAVDDPPSGPVLLVDDLVGSRWTLTVVGHILREAGCDAVFPLALADTSRQG